jgi:hypothetical protein
VKVVCQDNLNCLELHAYICYELWVLIFFFGGGFAFRKIDCGLVRIDVKVRVKVWNYLFIFLFLGNWILMINYALFGG